MKLRRVVAGVLLVAVGCGDQQPTEVEARPYDGPDSSAATTSTDAPGTSGSAAAPLISEVPVPKALSRAFVDTPRSTTAKELTFIPEQTTADSLPLIQVDPRTGEATDIAGPQPGGWLADVSMLATPEWLVIGATVCPDPTSEGDTGRECTSPGQQTIFVGDAAGVWRSSQLPADSNIAVSMVDEDVVVWESGDGLFETSLDDLTSSTRGPAPPDEGDLRPCRTLDPGVSVSFVLETSTVHVARPSGEETFPVESALDGWGDLGPADCYGSGESLILDGLMGPIPPPGFEDLSPEVPQGAPVEDTIDRPDDGEAKERQPRPAQLVMVESGASVDLPFTTLSQAATTGDWVLASGSEGLESLLWMQGPDGSFVVDDWLGPTAIVASSTGAIALEHDQDGIITSMKVFGLDG